MPENEPPRVAVLPDSERSGPRLRLKWFSLADGLAQRQDNFLLLRLIAAALVIYGHSNPISGSGPTDLFLLLGLGSYSGTIAVDIFFVTSGFLITGSYLRRHNIFEFAWARFLRIVPAYFVCITLGAFVIGALYTTLPLGDYLLHPEVRGYVIRNIQFGTDLLWNLPGVFTDHPKQTVNGSLWTLPAEVRMYTWVAILGLLGILRRRWLFIVVVAGLFVLGLVAPEHVPLVPVQTFLRLAGMFLLGALCYVNRDRIPAHGLIVVAIALLGWAGRNTILYPYLFALGETAFVFWFAYRLRWYGFNRFGDYSYGLYLWGFPVQQVVLHYLPQLPSLGIAAISLPIALLIGIVSWYCIERPALRLKDWPAQSDVPFFDRKLLGTLSMRDLATSMLDLAIWVRDLAIKLLSGRSGIFVFLAIAVVLQLPLILNPGYFSHDELQWLVLADSGSWSNIPWSQWFNFAPFQFRPLTFNLWLVVMHAFGYQPMLAHAATIAIGLLNAAMLRKFIMRLGVPMLHASLAALIFLVTPYVVFVHAWVGTIADLLWLAFVLLALLFLSRGRDRTRDSQPLLTGGIEIIVIALLTWLALLSKESAIVFPLLLLCAWPLRGRKLAPAIVASSLMVALYLWLRLDTILFTPHEPGVYGWSFASIPTRAFASAIFPFIPKLLEVYSVTVVSLPRLAFGVVGASLFIGVFASVGWRWMCLLIFGWLACLGPTLILDIGSNVYVYVASAFACGVCALVFSRMSLTAKGIFGALVALVVVHGFQVGAQMRHVGRLQHHLYESLDQILPTIDPVHPIRVRAQAGRDDFVVTRLLYRGIRSYRGIPLGDRVEVIGFDDKSVEPSHLMLRSGYLEPMADIEADGGD
ncbi:MAG: acyltransferase [Dokdonella sp.]